MKGDKVWSYIDIANLANSGSFFILANLSGVNLGSLNILCKNFEVIFGNIKGSSLPVDTLLTTFLPPCFSTPLKYIWGTPYSQGSAIVFNASSWSSEIPNIILDLLCNASAPKPATVIPANLLAAIFVNASFPLKASWTVYLIKFLATLADSVANVAKSPKGIVLNFLIFLGAIL